MQKHKDSHLDHNLSPAVVDYIMAKFADRAAFFIETFELPSEFGSVWCHLWGPIMGDPPVAEAEARYIPRGLREYPSRTVGKLGRPTRIVTVIGGPHEEHACILYTAFGGPSTPKEVSDPTLAPEKLEESRKFWSEHALAL